MTDFLQRRYVPQAIVALGVILVLPSLWSGRLADDYIHDLKMRDAPGFRATERSPMDLFTFSSGDPRETKELMEEGVFSWWTVPQFKLSFWRPLSCLTHWADHVFLNGSAPCMHLHSVLWLGAFLVCLWILYRRFFPQWIACLCLLLFAVDDAHGLTVGFIANRNALIAGVWGLLSLVTHDRAIRDVWRPGRVLSPVFLAMGLLGGEAAAAILGYLVPYAFFVDERKSWRRMLQVTPHLCVLLVWLCVHRFLGYGVNASGVYIDPMGHPLLFLSHLATRLPILLASQFAFPTADFWIFYPRWMAAMMLAIALLLLSGLFWLLWPHLKEKRSYRFWAVGAVISAIPFCATFPSDRLLLIPGIGAMALLGSFLADSLFAKPSTDPPGIRKRLSRAAGWSFVAIHLFLAPLTLPVRSLTVGFMEHFFNRVVEAVPLDPDLNEKSLIVVTAPADGFVCYMPYQRQALGLPRPHCLRILSTGPSAGNAWRKDAFTLVVEREKGFLQRPAEKMVRGPLHPMKAGDTVELSDVEATILRVTEDGRPSQVEFRFRRSLDDPSFLWFYWKEGALAPFVPPPPGETTPLPAVHPFALLKR